jgi:hypothetical protein
VIAMISLEIASKDEARWGREDWRCAAYIGAWMCAIVLIGLYPGVGQASVRFYYDPTAYCQSLYARSLCSQSFITLKEACVHAQSDLAYCQAESLSYMDRVNSACGERLEEYYACERDCGERKEAARLCVKGVKRPEWLLEPDIGR